MLMAQIETVKTSNIPSAIKKVENKLEDQMIMIKAMVSSKIKKLEKSLPELIGKHAPSGQPSGRRSKQNDSGKIRISGEVVIENQIEVLSEGDIRAPSQLKSLVTTPEVDEPTHSPDDLVQHQQPNSHPTSHSRSQMERTLSGGEHNSSTGENDEYIKMLIR